MRDFRFRCFYLLQTMIPCQKDRVDCSAVLILRSDNMSDDEREINVSDEWVPRFSFYLNKKSR